MFKAALLCLLCYLMVCHCSFILRLRQKNGKMSRLSLKADSSFNDLHGALEKAVNISDSAADYLLFGNNSKPISSLQGNRTKLAEVHVLHGDIVSIASDKSRIILPARMNRTAQTRDGAEKKQGRSQKRTQKRKRILTLSDLNESKSSLVKITRQLPSDALFVEISTSVPKVLKQWESTPVTPISGFQRTAILLGKRIVSPHPQNTSLLVQTVEVSGLVQLETPLCAYDSSETGAEALTEMNQWLLRKALTVGKAVDLVVVGCFVQNNGDGPVHEPATSNKAQRRPNLARKMLGLQKATLPSVSTETLPSTSPEDVRTCLRLRAAVAICMPKEEACKSRNSTDPFILLKRVLKKGRGAEDEVCLETFHLSDQALLLHAQGLIRRRSSTSASTDSNGESLPAQSQVSKSPRRIATSGPADALSSATMDLLGPVLLPNFVESRQVDSQLLVVPIAVRSSTAVAAAAAGTTIFPSLQQMQADGAVAKDAKKYLRKLLRRVLSLKGRRDEETLSRLRDINLLLYLSILLDEPVLELLCEHLRSGSKKKFSHKLLPVEAAVSLEGLINEL